MSCGNWSLWVRVWLGGGTKVRAVLGLTLNAEFQLEASPFALPWSHLGEALFPLVTLLPADELSDTDKDAPLLEQSEILVRESQKSKDYFETCKCVFQLNLGSVGSEISKTTNFLSLRLKMKRFLFMNFSD